VAIEAAEDGHPEAFDLPVKLAVKTASRQRKVESPNVIGLLPGSDPQLRDEYVVLTAHLDHVGIGEPVNGDRINNGAYDNASGIAIMLEIARAFAGLPRAPRRSLLFLAVTGEEKGLLGSDFFLDHATVPAEAIVANVNLDMVLMLHPLIDVVAFGAEHSSLSRVVERATSRLGVKLSPDPIPEEVLFIRSDQYPFVRRGIPAIFVVSGLETPDPSVDGKKLLQEWMRTTYHSPGDDMGQEIDFDAGAKFARVNFLASYLVASDDARPTWNPDDFFGELVGR
jgi:Zn-dependent M28 family amino/carboxypeptidase